MASNNTSVQLFDDLLTKFSQLLYRKEGDRSRISKILDDLNGLDYRYQFVNNHTKAVLLVNQCCTLVPPDDSLLVAKCCHLITNLVNRQHISIEGKTFSLVVQWCLQSLNRSSGAVAIDLLVTLDVLVRNNTVNKVEIVYEILVNDGSILRLASDSEVPEVVLLACQCLEGCVDGLGEEKVQGQLDLCKKVFLQHLLAERNTKYEALLYSKLLISCIKGLQNVMTQRKECLESDPGLYLGIVKSYMVYGLKNVPFALPRKVLPSALSIPEPVASVPRDKKGGKILKQRKHRGRRDVKKIEDNEESAVDLLPDISCVSISKLKTSDSDFSDTEGGRKAKLGITEGRVRQAALNFLLAIINVIKKRSLFSYWSSLISESRSCGVHYLNTCILKDPSPRGRMAALNVLLILLSSSKIYLAQAELSTKTASFTPLSVVIGLTIKELHRCLCLALTENSIPVLLLVLKCLAALVQATPYHKLEKGLITKIVRNVKGYIHHRDSTLQVAALIVLGCILAVEPAVAETKDALSKFGCVNLQAAASKTVEMDCERNLDSSTNTDEEYAVFSSDEEVVGSDYTVTQVPWLLQRCLENLGAISNESQVQEVQTPAPVRLESLQILSVMSRNYFATLMLPYISSITKALDVSLSDKYTDVKLHAARTLDFIGQAVHLHLNNKDSQYSPLLEQASHMWLTLLNGSLISLIQDEEHCSLRTAACDCLGSLGHHVFEQLPVDKQILIVTVLFSCSRDDESTVKAAAVRALAICVLYPSLREDSGFVVDTAETIHRNLSEDSIPLRIKASWALGNLSDSLVLNKLNCGDLDEFPDALLLRLLEVSIAGCSDNDKVRTNVVRAIGNLLRLVNEELMDREDFRRVVVNAIEALVKCASNGSNMKVRWNSCHAISNLLKNPVIYVCSGRWQSCLYWTLSDLVIGFRNFKVRINAALALGSTPTRELYGQYYVPAWSAMVRALENSQNMEDYTEYKHRDQLIEQICLTVGHLTTLLTIDDVPSIGEIVAHNCDLLKTHVQRVYERLVPEKSTVLYRTESVVRAFLSSTAINEDRKQVLKLLWEIFEHNM